MENYFKITIIRNCHKLNVDLPNAGKIKSRRAFLYVLETSNWVSDP